MAPWGHPCWGLGPSGRPIPMNKGGSCCLVPALASQEVATSPWEFLCPIPRLLSSVIPGSGATHVVHLGTVPRELPCGGRGCAAQLAAGGWDWGQFGQRVPGRTDVGLPGTPGDSPCHQFSPGPTACTPPRAPGLSPRSSPAAKIKYSICIAGKSCKSLLSLSSCSRNISGVICVVAHPAAHCSSPVWTTLPFPQISPGDAVGLVAERDPSDHGRAPHGTHCACCGDEDVRCPHTVRDGDTGVCRGPTRTSLIPAVPLAHQPCTPLRSAPTC